MNISYYAARLCVAVTETEDMPNPTARIAAWIVGLAVRTGRNTIEVSVHEMQHGFFSGGARVVGTKCHHNTIKVALDWLEQRGFLKVTQGAYLSGGKYKHIITVQ